MDEMNVPQTDAIVITAELLPPITAKTTLGEVIAMLRLGERPVKTPGMKILRMSSEPIADMNGCTLFRNGFAIYENASGRTVVWLPYCTSFTYYFNKLRDSEKDTLSETYELPDGFLETQPWVISVTLIGDHRVEANVMNRNGSRVGSTDFDSSDNGDKDGDAEEAVEKKGVNEALWLEDRMGMNPMYALLQKEKIRNMLDAMPDKQREVFTLHLLYGYKQKEIAEYLGISPSAVTQRLNSAKEAAKNFLKNF